jgi:Sec-independent protein translocase protein TatA
MRLYDFKEHHRFRRIAREFGWSMREYKEVVRAVDSLFDELEFRSENEITEQQPPRRLRGPESRLEKRHEDPSGDSASANS